MAKSKRRGLASYVERTLKLKGLSPGDVSERSGGAITRAYVAGIRAGTANNPSVKKLTALARGLGEDPLELFRAASDELALPSGWQPADASHTLMVLNLMQRVVASAELTEILQELVLLPRADLAVVLQSLKLLNQEESKSQRKNG